MIKVSMGIGWFNDNPTLLGFFYEGERDMKKSLLLITMLLVLTLGVNNVKASSDKKKVQTNFQYKLVCGYYNGSDELTWGSQEYNNDFKNYDGTESNSNRACGTTSVTKNYPLGDPEANNLPRDVEMIYDNCMGSTGKQAGKVGQSCSNEGAVRTCTVKWTGYCYKDPNASKKTNSKKKRESKNFSLTNTSIYTGETTEISQNGACYEYKVVDDDILAYDENDDSFKGLKAGRTYIKCYDQDGKYLSRKAVKVKQKTEYRYVTEKTAMYKDSKGQSEEKVIKKGSKVKYLTVKVNGYCKIKKGFETGYVECEDLTVEKV